MTELDSDAALMRRVAAGDVRAIRQLVSASLPRVFAFSSRLLGDHGEAEDVTQEALLRVCRQAARWETGRARIDTWLHTVTLNLCRDRLRLRRPVTTDQVPDQPDQALNPEQSLLQAEQEAMVAAAIRALPERQREAILLVHYQNFSGVEAATALGVSIDALESLLSRARRSLRLHFLEQDRAYG